MRGELIATLLAALLSAPAALAQVGAMGAPTPGMGLTSPLGITPNSSESPTGIPFGATELASPGLSPALIGTSGMPSSGAACSTSGGSSSEMSTSSGTYDGGGMAVAGGSPLTGGTSMSGMCAAASGGSPPSATSTPSPGGASRAGIPLDSVEIGNAGLSPLVTVPAPSSYPSTMGNYSPTGSGAPCSMMGPSPPSPSMSSAGC